MSDVVEQAKDALAASKCTGDMQDFFRVGLVAELVAEVEKVRRAAKTLGKMIDDSLMDVAKATDSLDLLDENRDGDWMLIFERLMQLRPARDEALAAIQRVRDLHSPVTDCTDELCCTGCSVNYGDCPTIAALDGDQ